MTAMSACTHVYHFFVQKWDKIVLGKKDIELNSLVSYIGIIILHMSLYKQCNSVEPTVHYIRYFKL